jgi:ParB family transcriptional regulator, chromosome partitioning protein
MAATIRTTGVVQALIVRPLAEPEKKVTHEIVAGARRFRASQLAGIADVPVDIRTLTDDQAIDIQQIENLQREDLTPLEEAQAYLAMLSQT